jgi:nucleotide-binding universal stress UspA family protein
MARLNGARLLERRPDDGGASRWLATLARRPAADLVVVTTGLEPSPDIGRLTRSALDSGVAVLAIPPGERAALQMGRIGVGYDGGAAAERALARGVDLVRLAGAAVASVEVAYVDDGDSPPDEPDARGLRSGRDAMIEWWLESRSDEIPAPVRPLRLEGDPVEALADLSQDLDLLIIGARPRGWLRRLVAGDVCTGLLAQTRCPLLVSPRTTSDRSARTWQPRPGRRRITTSNDDSPRSSTPGRRKVTVPASRTDRSG